MARATSSLRMLHRAPIWHTNLGILYLVLGLCACQKVEEPAIVWDRYMQSLGTLSSPRVADLTGDGVLDIVIGAGLNEFEESDSAVIAMDGRTGRVLWSSPGRDQMYGSPVFMDINADAVPDVIIAGRAAQLKAIDGTNGATLWEYQVAHHEQDAKGYMRFNFYNPQLVPDQNADGLQLLKADRHV